jgi:hypothetical protein
MDKDLRWLPARKASSGMVDCLTPFLHKIDVPPTLHPSPRHCLIMPFVGGHDEASEVARLIHLCQQSGGHAAIGHAGYLLLPELCGTLIVVLVEAKIFKVRK